MSMTIIAISETIGEARRITIVISLNTFRLARTILLSKRRMLYGEKG